MGAPSKCERGSRNHRCNSEKGLRYVPTKHGYFWLCSNCEDEVD